MAQPKYIIRVNGKIASIKRAWNSAYRETGRIVKQRTDAHGGTLMLESKRFVKEDGDHVHGWWLWRGADESTLEITIRKEGAK